MTVVAFRKQTYDDALKVEGWRPYGDADEERTSGVVAWEPGEGFIRLKFAEGRVYRYTNESAGAEKIARMKDLAAAGEGLLAYVNRHVRDLYAERERRSHRR